MSGLLISGLDKGSVSEVYKHLDGCLYDNQVLQLDELKGGNSIDLVFPNHGDHGLQIQKIYLIGTKLLILCQENKQMLENSDSENPFRFKVSIGYAKASSLDLITYIYNSTRNEINENGVHFITNEGMYLHRILLEKERLKDAFQWHWPWNWNWCNLV